MAVTATRDRETPEATVTPPPTGGGRLGRDSTAQYFRLAVLVVGCIYFLVPIVWVLTAATKSPGELFSTVPFVPGTGLLDNWAALTDYLSGIFGRWAINSLIYSGVGAALSTLVSAMAGFALAKYQFRGRNVIFGILLGGVLLPQVTLVIPQYLIWAEFGITNSYAAMLLPVLINPFGIYLARIYAMGSIPAEIIEASRADGAGEGRVFFSIAMPLMVPGLITIFLLQFVNIWNNFLLPYVMLSDESLYPITMGLYTMLVRGSGESVLYSVVIMGAALSIIPLILLLLVLQRYWRPELLSGGLKG